MDEVVSRPRNLRHIDAALLTDLSVITMLWCIGISIVNPIGNFPIIDDEFYEPVVRQFLEAGQYRPPEANMPFITNMLWGALFSLPAGASYSALRFSSLFAGLLGLFGLYVLIRDLGQPRWIRLVVTLTVAFNPAYYALSHSFMTDVLFTVLCIWAAVFFVRGLESGADFEIALGTLLALAATLSRQIGMAVPIAFAGAMITRHGWKWRTTLRAVIPLGVCLIGLIGLYQWLAASGRLPLLHTLYANVAISTFTHARTAFSTPISNLFCTVVYLGLSLLPVLLLTVGRLSRAGSTAVFSVAAAGVAILVAAAAVRTRCGWSNVMPLPEGHLLRKSGIGILWLRGATHAPSLPDAFWACVTALAFVGAALLVLHLSVGLVAVANKLLQRARLNEPESITLFLVSCGIILALPYLGIRSTDRYLMPCLPFVAAGMLSFSTPLSTALPAVANPLRHVSCVLVAAFCLFSVMATRDYLAWHRVSAQASRDLMENDHVAAVDIDGGTEFNFTYPGPPDPAELRARLKELEHARPQYYFTDELRKQYGLLISLGWRTASPEYLVAFGPVPGYRIARQYEYANWMPPRVQTIDVLRKE